MVKQLITGLSILAVLLTRISSAQISPGDLAEVHAHLEGMSNCTQCHTLGDKVSNEKCLKCHSEIKERIDLNKGYHASTDVRSKDCVICHNDHHGRNFQIIRFNESTFNHSLTGYELLGSHNGKECKACHKAGYIDDPELKAKKYTYLGLDQACNSCHIDHHDGTLSKDCSQCHGLNKFKPADKFNHIRAKFQLNGKHLTVECNKCHKPQLKDGKEFIPYTGIAYSTCTNCHIDIHKGQFGQDCRQCHSEESFRAVKGLDRFDHGKTAFPLEGRHRSVNCKSCHKTSLTDPLKHAKCSDCHSDYHRDQFLSDGIKPDCSACHNVNGFTEFNYTIEQHNKSRFILDGAHLATPCFSCHKRTERWEFREIGLKCADCHPDIHSSSLDPKYYPDRDCASCHATSAWKQIQFDHNRTSFGLEGAHSRQSCGSCHTKKDETGQPQQLFKGLPVNCASCHNDIHYGQFISKGVLDCAACHYPENWIAVYFDHNRTRFKLEGKHANVACSKCHKEVVSENTRYIQYTYKDFKCETCHR